MSKVWGSCMLVCWDIGTGRVQGQLVGYGTWVPVHFITVALIGLRDPEASRGSVNEQRSDDQEEQLYSILLSANNCISLK